MATLAIQSGAASLELDRASRTSQSATGGANGTLTDSDGYYTISNLAAGNYSVIAEEHGLVFNNQFNNSITVGPSFSGADFSVDDLPAISITAQTPVAVEAGASGVFRISRTGPIGQAKDVYVFTVQGTAAKGANATTNDYFFTPDYVSASPFQSFTIPAGSAFLDVVVAARNDSSSEGMKASRLCSRRTLLMCLARKTQPRFPSRMSTRLCPASHSRLTEHRPSKTAALRLLSPPRAQELPRLHWP